MQFITLTQICKVVGAVKYWELRRRALPFIVKRHPTEIIIRVENIEDILDVELAVKVRKAYKINWSSSRIALDSNSCHKETKGKKRDEGMPSRQREWQQRMQKEGRCMICGAVAEFSCYCKKHRDARMRYLESKRPEDVSQKQHCSVCGEAGHNRRTCPKITGIHDAYDSFTEADSTDEE